uniref:Secreted protein n=1 Tax=Steinernema glaseri TaxID=37863 RepID=A0A1I7YK56_9BILA
MMSPSALRPLLWFQRLLFLCPCIKVRTFGRVNSSLPSTSVLFSQPGPCDYGPRAQLAAVTHFQRRSGHVDSGERRCPPRVCLRHVRHFVSACTKLRNAKTLSPGWRRRRSRYCDLIDMHMSSAGVPSPSSSELLCLTATWTCSRGLACLYDSLRKARLAQAQLVSVPIMIGLQSTEAQSRLSTMDRITIDGSPKSFEPYGQMT